MSTRRTPPEPSPADLEKIFPDKARFDQFKAKWPRIEERRGVKFAQVGGILFGAWYHAGLERIIQDGLNRSDFLQRRARMLHLLVDLGQEVAWLVNRDNFGPNASVAAMGSRPAVKGSHAITYGEAVFDGKVPPGVKHAKGAPTIDFESITRPRTELFDSLPRVLERGIAH